jgi:hypothetical protein
MLIYGLVERIGMFTIYRRKPGVHGVHAIFGTGLVQPGSWWQVAAMCAPVPSTDTNKIAVPALLYDTDPNEPSSLYLRLGRCEYYLNSLRTCT